MNSQCWAGVPVWRSRCLGERRILEALGQFAQLVVGHLGEQFDALQLLSRRISSRWCTASSYFSFS